MEGPMRTVGAWLIVGIASVGSVAQPIKPPFLVTIGAEAPATRTGPDSYEIRAGSDLFIKVRVTNTSKRNLLLGDDSDSRTGVDFYHQYEVRDKMDNPMRKQPISHPEIGSTFHGWPARALEPMASRDVASDPITHIYDLAKPGKYTIRMSRAITGNRKDGVVLSNTITVMVLE
jgi:hypothetical protein